MTIRKIVLIIILILAAIGLWILKFQMKNPEMQENSPQQIRKLKTTHKKALSNEPPIYETTPSAGDSQQQ